MNGPVGMSLPPNSDSGKRMRLKGRGLPGKSPGDQYVVLSVTVPAAVTKEQRDAYESLSKLWSANPRSDIGG